MNRRTVLVVALTLGATLAGCANVERSRDVANPAVPGEVLAAQVCSLCHGVDGNSISPQFPRLAGQQPAYLVNQLTHFREHNRSDPAGSEYMWGLSHYLSDAQIDALSKYYARQTPKPNERIDLALADKGKQIFEKGIPSRNLPACAVCHGPQAHGTESIPRLAGQHADYIIKQLAVFENRLGRPGTPMEFVAHSLTDENKRAVAAFLQDYPG